MEAVRSSETYMNCYRTVGRNIIIIIIIIIIIKLSSLTLSGHEDKIVGLL
jgi:hypothetical protein